MEEFIKTIEKYNLEYCDHDIEYFLENDFDTDETILELNAQYIKNFKNNISDYKLLGRIEISKEIYKGLNEFSNLYLYVLFNINSNRAYIGLDRVPFFLWYEIDTKENDQVTKIMDGLMSIYNLKEYPDNYKKHDRSFIGTESEGLDIDDLERYFVFNEHFEHLTWGSAWSDFPFREQTIKNQVSVFDLAKLAYYSLRQSDPTVVKISCKTKISKSIIAFESRYGALLIDIKYNGAPVNNKINIINEKLERNYPLDVPLDILVPLLNFPYENHRSILCMKPLSIYNIDISLLLCYNKEMYNEIKSELLKLNTDDDISEELKTHIGISLDYIDYIVNYDNNDGKTVDENTEK